MDADLLKKVKHYLRIDSTVGAYDEEITQLIGSAQFRLELAGIPVKRTPAIDEYICTFVRTRMHQEASDAFRKSEFLREDKILTELWFMWGER